MVRGEGMDDGGKMREGRAYTRYVVNMVEPLILQLITILRLVIILLFVLTFIVIA